MNPVKTEDSHTLRPSAVCRALLAALDASDERRRNRKRDQTADAFGLAIKRDLLQRAVGDDPPADAFEEWLLNYPLTCTVPELVGPAFAMARAVFDEWRLAHTLDEFRLWLERGAPSDDADRSARRAPGPRATDSPEKDTHGQHQSHPLCRRLL